MKKVWFAEAGVIDDYIYDTYEDEADGMTHLDLSDDEFISVSTGKSYTLEGYFYEFNHGFHVPDPDNFFCRIIEED